MKKAAFCKKWILSALIFPFLLLPGTPLSAQSRNLLSLSLKDAKLETAISAIERQSPYLFVVRDVDLNTKVSVDARRKPIEHILEQMLAGTGIGWRLDGVNVILNPAKSVPQEAPRKLAGTVLDAAGQPVIGASVFLRGTKIGTVTAADGSFSLSASDVKPGAVLEINCLGYEAAAAPVGIRDVFRITLAEASTVLDQVVVTALGIKRSEKALSYNVQQVKSEEVTAIKDANFVNALSGKLAGVTINQSSAGAGGAAKVVMRGSKSIQQSSNALYVIDGIPMFNFGGGGDTEFGSRGFTEAIADLNPDDIESISALNGAAAAALYGSNAANGAILITTRRGAGGKPLITFSSNTEWTRPFVLPRFQQEYGIGSRGNAAGSTILSWGPKLPEAARTGYTPGDFFETGNIFTNSLTLSAGSERNQTFFSAAAVDSDGYIPNNRYDRYNFTFRNTTSFFEDRVKFDVGASYILQNDRNMTNQGVYSNPLVPAYLFPRGDDFENVKIFERWDPSRLIKTQYWPQGEGDLRMQNPY